MNISFHVNRHDEDGDVSDEGIFIWFDDIFSLKVGNMVDLNKLISDLKKCKDEILETYGYIE